MIHKKLSRFHGIMGEYQRLEISFHGRKPFKNTSEAHWLRIAKSPVGFNLQGLSLSFMVLG